MYTESRDEMSKEHLVVTARLDCEEAPRKIAWNSKIDRCRVGLLFKQPGEHAGYTTPTKWEDEYQARDDIKNSPPRYNVPTRQTNPNWNIPPKEKSRMKTQYTREGYGMGAELGEIDAEVEHAGYLTPIKRTRDYDD